MRKILLPLIGAVALAACAPPADNQASSDAARLSQGEGIFSQPYLETTLENGLKVVIVPTDYPDVVTIQIPVQTGSRNEVEEGKSGFAHFFEHMMFRGTENYSAEEYLALLKEAGADQNAYTSDDLTNYHITFTKDDLETVIMLEADRFQDLKYTEEQFRTEALAVKGEYLKNSANPIMQIFERIRDLSFDTHTYQHTTMGFFRDIEDMPNQFEYSHQFFDRWYRPENTTVILAGDLDPERTLALVEKYWGGWQSGEAEPVTIPQEGPPKGPQYEHITWDSPTQPWVVVGFRGPAFDPAAKDMPAMDLIAQLYFSPTSDLYRELVIEKQLADAVQAYFPNSIDPNVMMILARLNKPEAAREVTDRILETLADARTRLVGESRLADTKSNLKYGFAAALDNSDAIGSTLAGFAHFTREPITTINTLYRTYDSITAEDVRDYANRYFVDASRVVITLSNTPSLAGMNALPSLDEMVASRGSAPAKSDEARAPWDESAHREAIAARTDGQPADIEMLEMPGKSDLVDINLLFRAGTALDPEGKKGLAALTAAMVSMGGSKFHDINEINAALYPLAASFEPMFDKEMTSFRGTVHKDNLARYYDIVSEQLLNPGWRESDFQRVKTLLLNSIRTNLRSSNDEEFAKEALYERIYGPKHPYGTLNSGHIGDIESITLDDVKNFYARHYTPANLIVGIAGGYDKEFVRQLRADLAALPKGGKATVSLPQPPAIERNRALIITKETQPVAVSFGHAIDVRRGDPDWVALWLARSWLGEHRSSNSHLYKRIREARGMNYGDYAYIEYFPRGMYQFHPDANLARRQQIFQVWLRPLRSNNDAHFATRVALYELNKLIEEGLTQEEFEATRSFLDKFVAQLVSTQGRQLAYMLDSRFYGIGPFTDYVREGLDKLTVDDVNAAIRRHLRADKLQFVFITRDGEDLRNRLLNNTPSPMEYATEMPEDILIEDQAIQELPISFAPDAVEIVPAEEVFE